MTKPPVPRTCLSAPLPVELASILTNRSIQLRFCHISPFQPFMSQHLYEPQSSLWFSRRLLALMGSHNRILLQRRSKYLLRVRIWAILYLASTDVSISPLNSLLRPVDEACRLHRTRHLRSCSARRLDPSKLALHPVRVRSLPSSTLLPLPLHSSSVC